MGFLKDISKDVKSMLQIKTDMREDSLTDFILCKISTVCNDIKYYHFNQREEGKNGADWVWCFRVNNRYYPMYVQAKKFNKDNDIYKGINYSNPKTKRKQIDLLISNATSHNMPATYIIYTDTNPVTMCCDPYEDEGAFLINANIAKRINDKYLSKSSSFTTDLFKYSIGISCLERCSVIIENNNLKNGFENFINKYLIEKSNGTKFTGYESDGLPDYLNDIVQSMNGGVSELPDWFESKHHKMVTRLNGVVIFNGVDKIINNKK